MTLEPLRGPDPQSAVIEVGPETRVLGDAGDWRAVPPDQESRFGDDVWHIPPHALDPSGEYQRIYWAGLSGAFRLPLKRLTFALLHRPTPVELFDRPSNSRTILHPASVITMLGRMSTFATWLAERGVGRFRDADEAVLNEYFEHVRVLPGASGTVRFGMLWAVSRMWLHGQYLPASDRVPQPPWEVPGGPRLGELLGVGSSAGENSTDPIDPDTIGMSFKWWEWLIGEASPDIERALARRNALLATVREEVECGDRERWEQYLRGLRAEGGALPGRLHTGRVTIARSYLAAKVGVGENIIACPADLSIEVGAPLGIEITGEIAGKPWTDDIDFYDVDRLVRHLATACLLTTAYITGMRGKEVRALERGCCQRVDRGRGLPPGYEIHGRKFKVAGPDGNWIPGGQERDRPWPGIMPVPEAVAVMERLHRAEQLFPQSVFSRRRSPLEAGIRDAAVTRATVRYAIARLNEWCNATAGGMGLPEAKIPDDPLGTVTINRLRRTMAWFVYHQPFGRLSLGSLFEHAGLHVTDGYGTQIFTGQRSAYHMEEASAIAERFAAAAELLEAGEKVSGPAAQRYLATFSLLGQFEGMHLEREELAALAAEQEGAAVYGNDSLHLTCLYDATQALCHPDRDRAPRPSLAHCQRQCANVVYTDSDISEMQGEIQVLRTEAATPGTSLPKVVRCGQRAEHLAGLVAAHGRERVGLGEGAS